MGIKCIRFCYFFSGLAVVTSGTAETGATVETGRTVEPFVGATVVVPLICDIPLSQTPMRK